MNPRDIKKIPIEWDGLLSQSIKADDFRNIGITAVGTGDLQCLASKDKNTDDTSPDFSNTSTITNSWAAIVIADETVTGAPAYDTTLTVTAETKLAEANTNLATFICLSRSVDTLDAFITVTDNS